MTLLRPQVLYRGEGTTVTTAYVETYGRRYRLSELSELWRVEGRARWFEVWAKARGDRVRLFWSRDVQEFGKVVRALIRARELAGLA